MKPRDLLIVRIQQDLCELLATLGFKFARSKLTFSRKSAIVTQKVAFQLDRWNSENDCWNIPGWSRRFADHACLHNDDNDAAVMRTVYEDFVRVGIPFLDSISSYGEAGQYHAAEKDWVAAADYFLLAGDRDRAQETLLNGISEISTHGEHPQRTPNLPQLELRLTKFFGEVTCPR